MNEQRTIEQRVGRVRRAPDGSYRYSEKVRGERGNYRWPVSFDVCGSCVGINQYDPADGSLKDRILLSAAQYAALVAFAEKGK